MGLIFSFLAVERGGSWRNLRLVGHSWRWIWGAVALKWELDVQCTAGSVYE